MVSTTPVDVTFVARLQEIFETTVKPAVRKDGGDIEFVKFQDGIVYVSLSGACVSCPSSYFTLKMGVCELLQTHFPEVIDVVAC